MKAMLEGLEREVEAPPSNWSTFSVKALDSASFELVSGRREVDRCAGAEI